MKKMTIKIKKLRKINETEKRTDIILDDPKFRNWFKGSKVVDSNGKPLVCFHGTKVTFDSFRPLSHFGTIEASNRFVDNKPLDIEREFRINDNITPVYLSIKNPLEIKDEDNYAPDLGFDMYKQGFISYDELIDVYDNIRYGKNLNDELQKIITDKNINVSNKRPNFPLFLQNAGYKLNTKKFISIFKNKGYDGFYYKNEIEDEGVFHG